MISKLHLDPATCTGHGLCADLLPELVELDEWGFPIVHADVVGPELLSHARRAISACPTLALSLLRSGGSRKPGHR